MADGRSCWVDAAIPDVIDFAGGMLHVDESTSEKVTIRIQIPVMEVSCPAGGGYARITLGPLSATASTAP